MFFSDDSGLEVEALGMAPGVKTARYAGLEKDAHRNMDKLLNEMKNHLNRKARFRAVVSLFWEGKEYLFEGIVDGRISESKKGNQGFGYDPVFIPEGYDQTFAELGDAVKNAMSHRFKAVEALKAFIVNEMANKKGQ